MIKVTDPSLLEELNGSLSNQSQDKPESMLDRTANFAQKYINEPVQSSRLPEIAGGVLQGAYDTGRSIGNIPMCVLSKLMGKDMSIPSVDLGQYGKQDPTSKAAFMGGEVLGSVAPAAKVYKGAEAALGAPTMLKRALAGSATGAAIGQSGDEDGNGRLTGALLGGALPAISSVTPASLGKRIVNQKNSLQEGFKKSYNDLFGKIEQAGIAQKDLKIPGILNKAGMNADLALIKTSAPREFTKSLDAFKASPSFQNAHDVQSDLGKLSRYLQTQGSNKLTQGKEISSSKQKAEQLTKELQKRMRGTMQDFLLKNNKPDLLKEYSGLTKSYAKDYVPYLHPSINKYEQGKHSASKMLKSLNQSDKFLESSAAKNLPGLKGNKALNSPAGKLAGAAVGVPLLYKFGLPGLGKALDKGSETFR
jgi:hypothetical protein